MTYVTDQSPQELRQHMRSLKKMPGWHEPLSDRLFKEVEAQDAKISQLRTALKYGRDCVMESFEHVKSTDDQVMADARLQAIDAALETIG